MLENTQKPANGSEERPLSIGKRLFSIPTLISFAVAFSLIAFLALRFNIDWRGTWDNIKNANVGFFALALVLYYFSFVFRGLRWRILARNAKIQEVPGAKIPSLLKCSQFILLGWFINTVTWFRLGDAYRAYVFSQESKSGFPRSFGTVLAERVIDMATVFVLLVAGAAFLILNQGIGTSSTANWSQLLRGLVVIALVMVAALVVLMILMGRFGIRLSRFLPQRLQLFYERFHHATMGSFKNLPLVFALSAAGWFLEAGRLFYVVRALNLDLSLSLVLFVSITSALLSTVPLTPGGLGFVETGIVGLLVLSLDRHDAISVAILDRSISYLSVVIFGGLLFLVYQIVQARARKRTDTPSTLTGTSPPGEST